MDEDNGNNKNEIVLVKPIINGDKSVRNEKGQFGPGNIANPKGKPKGQKNYLTLIEESLRKEAIKAGVSYWDKIASWAMTNPMSGYALLKKFVPDKEKIEHSGIEPIQITIERANAEDNS